MGVVVTTHLNALPVGAKAHGANPRTSRKTVRSLEGVAWRLVPQPDADGPRMKPPRTPARGLHGCANSCSHPFGVSLMDWSAGGIRSACLDTSVRSVCTAGTTTLFIDLGFGGGPLLLGLTAARTGIPLAFIVGAALTATAQRYWSPPSSRNPPNSHRLNQAISLTCHGTFGGIGCRNQACGPSTRWPRGDHALRR